MHLKYNMNRILYSQGFGPYINFRGDTRTIEHPTSGKIINTDWRSANTKNYKFLIKMIKL